MAVDTSNLKYNPRALQLRLTLRLENWWHGVRDRKDTFKRFCQELDIDYPPVTGKKYMMPDTYAIQTDWVQYLSKLRDKFIANQSPAYHTANKRVQIEIDKVQGTLAQHERYLEDLKVSYVQLRNRLKAEKAKKDKDSLEIISLEAAIEKKQAKISNCQSDIEEVRADLKILRDVLSGNNQSWLRQVEITDVLVRQTAKKYAVYATKRINRRLNYTSFVCPMPDTSEIIKKLEEEK